MNTAPKIIVKTLLASLALNLCPVLGMTNSDMQQKMQQLLQQSAKADQPGFAVLVRKGNDILTRGGYGMANLELAVPMQADMKFRIASQTKQFTAVAVLQLVQAGKLKLTDTVGSIVKDYPAVGRDLTVHQLLTHTAGLKNLSRLPEFRENKPKDATLAEMVALFSALPLEFKPGRQFRYSNSNYVLLTALIEAVSKQSYADYLQQHVFTPLGMSNSGYDSTSKILPNRASGYEQGPQGLVNARSISMTRPQGAGALYSTVDDLNLWDQALYTDKLVKQPLLQQSFVRHKALDGTPQPYGYGWMMADWEAVPTQEHSGGIEGFSSYIIRIPSEQIYVTVLANSAEADTYSLAVKLAAIAMGKPFDPKAIRLDPQRLKLLSGSYQFADGTVHHVRQQGNALMYQAPEMPPVALIPTAEGRFYLQGDFTYLSFNPAGTEMQLKMRGFAAQAGNKVVPTE
jgi:CubicO group peptidase (beta-lactamase class C family)